MVRYRTLIFLEASIRLWIIGSDSYTHLIHLCSNSIEVSKNKNEVNPDYEEFSNNPDSLAHLNLIFGNDLDISNIIVMTT